jgi:RNA polymerase sigma factor (sigma-70 family)
VGREDRQDLLQEVYFRLLEKQGQRLRRCRAQGQQAVGAYLSRIAESVVIDHLRAEAATKRGRGRVVSDAGDGELGPFERAPDRGPSPEERVLLREKRRLFARHCRDAVGPRHATRDLRVLYLAFFEGWTSGEISGRLGGGLTPSSVDSLLHRLKRRLARAGLQVPRRA